MRWRVMLGPTVLRVVGLGAVLVLLLNPARSRRVAGGAPLVLLDASLSMAGANASWRAALDTARRLARGGPIWRFGDRLTGFDSTPPADGASRLAPALTAAAARGGPIIVVTDGAIDDAATLAPDLRRRARIVVLPRAPFYDAFVAGVEGPGRVSARDTLRLRVTYGVAGSPPPGAGPPRDAALTVSSAGHPLVSHRMPIPDSGTLATSILLPAARLPAGWSALEVRIAAREDAEPRDDARRLVVDVSPQPSVVVLAAPPGWEARFFARTLAAVARVPVRLYDETEPGRWRDGATLAPVSADALRRAARGARLLALIGDPRRFGNVAARSGGGVVAWSLVGGREGDWYVDPPPGSPLAGALAGIVWDSLPPVSALEERASDSSAIVLLTARLARRGPRRPLVLLQDSAGVRGIRVSGSGLWRWAFRGGAASEAYRSLVAAMADWLLGAGARTADRVEPVTTQVANGLPLVWQWKGAGTPRAVSIALRDAQGERVDTLRFDATGEATLRLPPGEYRWRASDGPERGMVAVEEYSDEWRPALPSLAAQAGEVGGERIATGARDHWWWYWVAIAAFAGEWVWRRRRGLP